MKQVLAAFLALLLIGCTPLFGGAPPAPASTGVATLFAASPTAAPQSNSCTAPISGYCGGCSVSCPAAQSAFCSTGLTDYSPTNTGHSPVCRVQPRCYCSS